MKLCSASLLWGIIILSVRAEEVLTTRELADFLIEGEKGYYDFHRKFSDKADFEKNAVASISRGIRPLDAIETKNFFIGKEKVRVHAETADNGSNHKFQIFCYQISGNKSEALKLGVQNFRNTRILLQFVEEKKLPRIFGWTLVAKEMATKGLYVVVLSMEIKLDAESDVNFWMSANPFFVCGNIKKIFLNSPLLDVFTYDSKNVGIGLKLVQRAYINGKLDISQEEERVLKIQVAAKYILLVVRLVDESRDLLKELTLDNNKEAIQKKLDNVENSEIKSITYMHVDFKPNNERVFAFYLKNKVDTKTKEEWMAENKNDHSKQIGRLLRGISTTKLAHNPTVVEAALKLVTKIGNDVPDKILHCMDERLTGNYVEKENVLLYCAVSAEVYNFSEGMEAGVALLLEVNDMEKYLSESQLEAVKNVALVAGLVNVNSTLIWVIGLYAKLKFFHSGYKIKDNYTTELKTFFKELGMPNMESKVKTDSNLAEGTIRQIQSVDVDEKNAIFQTVANGLVRRFTAVRKDWRYRQENGKESRDYTLIICGVETDQGEMEAIRIGLNQINRNSKAFRGFVIEGRVKEAIVVATRMYCPQANHNSGKENIWVVGVNIVEPATLRCYSDD